MQSAVAQQRLHAQLESFLRETAVHTDLATHLQERVEEELISAAGLSDVGKHASALSVAAR